MQTTVSAKPKPRKKSQSKTPTKKLPSLVIQDHPLILLPKLALALEALGSNGTAINDALIVQQLHYWLKHNKDSDTTDLHFHEGRWWTYNTYEQWQENFPFWSAATIKRSFTRLESHGIVLTGEFNKNPFSRTKWYSLDYEEIATLMADEVTESASETQSGEVEDSSVTRSGDDSMTSSYTETSSETNVVINSSNPHSIQGDAARKKALGKREDIKSHDKVALAFDPAFDLEELRESPLSEKQARQINAVITKLGGKLKTVYKAIDVWHEVISSFSEQDPDILHLYDLTYLHNFTLAINTADDLSDLASVFRNYFSSSLERYAEIDEVKRQIDLGKTALLRLNLPKEDIVKLCDIAKSESSLPNDLEDLKSRLATLWDMYHKYRDVEQDSLF